MNNRIQGINEELAKEYFRSSDDPGLKFKFTVAKCFINCNEYGNPIIPTPTILQFETCIEASGYVFASDSETTEITSVNIFLNKSDGELQKLTDKEIRAIMNYEDT
jgi:hypothetical protein